MYLEFGREEICIAVRLYHFFFYSWHTLYLTKWHIYRGSNNLCIIPLYLSKLQQKSASVNPKNTTLVTVGSSMTLTSAIYDTRRLIRMTEATVRLWRLFYSFKCQICLSCQSAATNASRCERLPAWIIPQWCAVMNDCVSATISGEKKRFSGMQVDIDDRRDSETQKQTSSRETVNGGKKSSLLSGTLSSCLILMNSQQLFLSIQQRETGAW